MSRSLFTLLVSALVALSTAGMVLQAGSVPHVHVDDEPAYFNQEHDLTLLAGLATQVVPSDAATSELERDGVRAPLPPAVPERLAVRFAASGESRAPPIL